MGLSCYRCHVQQSRTGVSNLSCDTSTSRVQLKAMRQNRQRAKMYVVHHNTLSDCFRIRIVWFQPKQDSDRKRISFFKNRIGSDSKKTLSDNLRFPAISGAQFTHLVERRRGTGSGIPESTLAGFFIFLSDPDPYPESKVCENRTRIRHHFSISAEAGVCAVIS